MVDEFTEYRRSRKLVKYKLHVKGIIKKETQCHVHVYTCTHHLFCLLANTAALMIILLIGCMAKIMR